MATNNRVKGIGTAIALLGALGLGCGGSSSAADGDGNGDDGIDDAGGTAVGGEGTTTGTPIPTSGNSADEGGGDDDGNADAGDDDDDNPPPPIGFDIGGIPDAPPAGCGLGESGGGGDDGELELSYIWIANSSQGTISKIDTETMVEEGRYTAKQFGGDPSRTSVNLNGDVAVASRNGGVSKFWANPGDCLDANGNGTIETSTGANDVLGWDAEECRAWYTDFVCGSNRPVAWTRGEVDYATCQYDASLWTVCDADVHLLDGETGAVMDTVPTSAGFVYGGAADADGNFWGLDVNFSQIFRVDNETLGVEYWPLSSFGGYGITVDHLGRPWTCGGGGVRRFNLDSETWDVAGSGNGIGGCMTDGESTIWHSNGSVLTGFDLETLAISSTVNLPEYVHGISVDFFGNVWGVSFAGSNAYRADPETGTVDTYSGLIGAYTYSDMTGFALQTAGAGGNPQG